MSSMSTKSVLDQIIFSRDAYGQKSRKYRKAKRRTIKRQERRAAAMDIQSQLDDMQAQRDEREFAAFMAKKPGELFRDLTDSLFNQNNWLFVDPSDSRIEAACCDNEWDSHWDYEMFETDEDERDFIESYRHASHLPENHIVDADDMVTLDQPQPELIPEIIGMRVGSKLAKSGSVYGKATVKLAPEPHDASDLADICENMLQAA